MLSQRDLVGRGTTQEWHVEIVTPEGEALHPQATLVELSTPDGQIGVMPGHERLVTALGVGELVIHNGRQRDVYLIGGGFARVHAERLSVLAFSLERATKGVALEKCRARQRELLGDNENDSLGDPME
jgi:ATP synthase F1 epsilon subunit